MWHVFKTKHFEIIEHTFLSSDFLNESLAIPFFQNLKTLKNLYVLNFHQVHPMNMYFHKNKNSIHKIWI
jgi:hypothetical protein